MSLTSPLGYLQADWCKEHITDLISGKFLNDEWTTVGVDTKAKNSSEEGPTMPAQPALQVLQWSLKAKKNGLATLKTPEKLMRQWSTSPSSGSAFLAYLEEMRKKFPLDLPISEDSDKKRNAAGRFIGGESSNKKPKTGSVQDPSESHVFQIDALPVPFCYEAVTTEKQVFLTICPGNRIFMVNKSQQAVTLRAGSVLCGWFKGKWHVVRNPASSGVPDEDIPFELKNSSQHVLMGNQVMSLSQVIASKRQSSPADAHIGFHSMEDAPTAADKKAFNVIRKTDAHLFFKMDNVVVKEEEEGKTPLVPSKDFAGLVPHQSWNSWCTEVLWSCRWPPAATKGLTPIRPFVVMSVSTTIPAQRAVELAGQAPADAAKTEASEAKEE